MRCLIALLLLATPAFAHSPVLDLSPKTRQAPLVVEEPEHSKAIFSELTGAPQYYQITSDEVFDFYVGLTAEAGKLRAGADVFVPGAGCGVQGAGRAGRGGDDVAALV